MNSFEEYDEKNVDKVFYNNLKCMNCSSNNLFFVCLVTNTDSKNIINYELHNECRNCGEEFATKYDWNKKIISHRSTGYCEPQRPLWIRKQKLEKLLK